MRQFRPRLALALALLAALLPCVPYAAQQAAGRARDVYERAVELEREGNHGAALSLFWEAAGLAPEDPDVQNRLGEALDRFGALDAAVDAFRRALAARPSFAKAESNLILTLVKAGKGTEAVSRARALVAASPENPEAHFILGLAQSEQDVAGAIETFRRTLALAPRHTLARYNLALVLKRADRTSEAAAELSRAIEIEPRPELHYTLGVIHWHQGDLDRASKELRAAVELDSRYADGYHALGSVLQARQDWKGAAAALRKALAIKPGLWSAQYTLGRVLQRAGDAAGGQRQLEKAEQIRISAQLEQEASVWTATGIHKLEKGDAEGAIELFRRATTTHESYAPAHYQMGRALQILGRHQESRQAFVRARQLNPSLVPPPGAR
jgi:tetratricopeptide (TPR) repeat protein